MILDSGLLFGGHRVHTCNPYNRFLSCSALAVNASNLSEGWRRLMGSLSTRPSVPSTFRAGVPMLQLDQTVVMEIRGHHIEPQTRNDSFKTSQSVFDILRRTFFLPHIATVCLLADSIFWNDTPNIIRFLTTTVELAKNEIWRDRQ